MTPRTLADLAVGASAIIGRVSATRTLAVRLMELGLVPGTEVTLCRKAPLGDPMELRIRGYSLSIRRTEAVNVLLREEHDPAP